MDNLGFGLHMTVFGMGMVFLMLALLMGLLYLIGLVDKTVKPKVEAAAPAPAIATSPPVVTFDADGLDEDTVAAITVAVIKHAEVRRQQAAPEMRTHQPGSLLHLSRWLSVGRSQQNQVWRRR